MNHETSDTAITLDNLLALVERAVRTIELLQAENAALNAKLTETQTAAELAVAEVALRARRIAELEQSEGELKKDAEWSRWFRSKYGNSTFYTHIERAYHGEQVDITEGPDVEVSAA